MSSHRAAEKHFLSGESPFVRTNASFSVSSILGVASWLWEPLYDRAVYSREWRNLLDLPAEHILGASISWLWERVFVEDREAFRDACLACVNGLTDELDMAVRLESAERSWRWVLLRAKSSDDGHGQRVSGVAIDVSRLRVDERFRPPPVENVRAYSAMLENSPDFIIRFDRQLFPLYINPVASTYLNIPQEQPIGKTCEELGIHADGCEFFRRNIMAVFEEGEGIRTTASLSSKLNGEITGEFCFWPELDAHGKVIAVTCHMSDLTEKIRAEQQVRRNEQRFSAMYQLAQMLDMPRDAIISFVVEQIAHLTKSRHSYLYLPDFGEGGKNCMFWSKSVHEWVGSEKLSADGIPSDCFTKEFACETTIRTPIVDNCTSKNEHHVSFGTLFIQRYMLVPAIEDGRVVCIASVCNKDNEYTDSDLRQLELFIHGAWLTLCRRRYVDDLKKAKESAEKASRVKDEFLANISHELRTPLNGMLSMLQLLELSPLADEQMEYVHTASLSGNSLLRIISDILDFSRMESGKVSLQTKPFDLRSTLLSTMNLFAGEASQRGLTISVDIDDRLPPILLGDDARVRQIFFNLAGNALKFTEVGGITVECSLLPYRKENQYWVYFAVRDTGVGIPPEAHSIIFESFTQIVGGKSGKYAGTGLGLSIVKQLVLHMGGSLTVDSQVGQGTTIHCSLPFNPPPKLSVPLHAMQWKEPVFRCLDILVAEDDSVGRFAMRIFLKRLGHRVVCVDTGRRALEALRMHAFDCLITDIQMPVMDGLEAVRRIRQGDFADIRPTDEVVAQVLQDIPEARREPGEIPQDLIVVAFTAHAMRGDREHFLRMGMDQYLSKPIIMEELQKVLQQILQQP